ncbi:hypothetical protein KC362_g19 [Hortaea werneckii]|nr:hypothetical protein KC362_g19 [Hortaea werneckii]
MSSLLALLAQQTPNLQTRKGLILLGLQNDFLSPDGKLPVSPRSGYLDRLKELVPAFREFGDVIWVRSEFEANRSANAEDDNSDAVIAGPLVQEPLQAGTGTKRKAFQDSSMTLSSSLHARPHGSHAVSRDHGVRNILTISRLSWTRKTSR